MIPTDKAPEWEIIARRRNVVEYAAWVIDSRTPVHTIPYEGLMKWFHWEDFDGWEHLISDYVD